MEAKLKKFTYWAVIQQFYGTWEDVSQYETDSQQRPIKFSDKELITPKGRKYKETLLKHDLREYSFMGYPTRVIHRKELNVKN